MIQTIAQFGNTRLPNGVYGISYRHVEKTSESESGRDLVIVTKLNKRTISATYNVDSHTLETIKTVCSSRSGTLSFLGESINCRPRLGSTNMVKGSERLNDTDGLWEVTVNFLEV